MKVKDNIAEEFNAFSKNYTEDMTKCVPHYLELLNYFIQHLPGDFSPKTILDLGSGNGNVVNTLLKRFPEAHYTLVDASQDMLDLCKQRFSNYNITLANSYFDAFNFKVDSFDFITAGFSLHHCKAQEKPPIYQQIFKTLKSEGIFACSDLMIERQSSEHSEHLKKWERFVNDNYPDNEKWLWLQEHYNQFDNPNSLYNHLVWLQNAGFVDFDINIHNKYWSHFKAYKT